MGKYEQDARRLLEYVGGKENIAAISHCVSRIRFVLNDPAKADVAKIEALKSAKESAEMLAVAIHFMRGTPYIYQGEELGMTNPHFTKIEQYRDVESRNYYRILREQGKTEAETLDIIAQRSRDDSRTPMQWDASENAGFTTGTPWIGIADNYKAINAAAQMDAPDSIRSFYKTLVALRKKMPVISAGKIEFLYPDNADLLAYRRYDGETELLVLCNLREREIAKPLPVGWTDAEKLLGNYPDTADTLRPYECVVLKK